MGYHQRLYLISIVLVVVLLVTFATVFFMYNSRRNNERFQELANTSADTISQNLDETLQNMRDYYADLAQNEDDDNLSYIMTEKIAFNRISVILKAQRKLSGSSMVGDYVNAYAFINRTTDLVITDSRVYGSVDEFGSSEEIQELWADRSLAYQGITFRWYESENAGSAPAYGSINPLNGLYLISFMPASVLDPSCLLIAGVDLNRLWKDVTGGLSEGQYITIVDRNTGKVLYSTSDDFASAVIAARQQQADAGQISGKLKTKNGTCMTAGSSMTRVSWDVYYGINLHMVNRTADLYMLFSLFLLVIIVLGAVVLAFQMIYKPVSRMADEISAESETKLQPGEDELTYVAENISRLSARNAELRGQVQELFARRLLNGELSDADIDTYISGLRLEDKIPPAYRIATIILRVSEEQMLSDQKENDIALDILSFCRRRGMADDFFPPMIYLKSIVCFVSEPETAVDAEVPTDIVSEPAVQLYKDLSAYVSEKYGAEIGMGISRAEKDIHRFHSAFRESVSALNSRHKVEEAAGVSKKHPSPGTESYYQFYMGDEQSAAGVYNSEWAQEINEAIRQADKRAAYDVVNKVTASIREQGISHEAAATVLLQFVNSVVVSAQENGIALESVLRDSMDGIYKTVMNSLDINFVRGYLKYKMIDPILYSVGENMTSQSHLILMSVEKLVEEHKGNITLAECAQALNYHPSYIWKIMKQEKNMTFTEYTDEYRLQLARDRLLNTDETVAAIAKELGYTNAQNFIRFFSKMTGTTPGKFRKNSREKG